MVNRASVYTVNIQVEDRSNLSIRTVNVGQISWIDKSNQKSKLEMVKYGTDNLSIDYF
ncbi:hypothetical protein [Heyndrickxia vini]|uniref:Uncharacterized protein n=1 Tax=Heyndrickxia vini TaxID=1476025 RepID=A0ABX7E1F4_9BACI|nr:hypothetical protein [Heyndrickxia vini]QQZ09080.1 hypothetical protein I5776_19185 [Heyndrickxia vini]